MHRILRASLIAALSVAAAAGIHASGGPSVALAQAPERAAARPRLTERQAIEIATRFCRALGRPVTPAHAPSAVYPAPPRIEHEAASYRVPRWRVSFGRKYVVEVADNNGTVVRFHDDTPDDELQAPAESPVNDAAARAAARKALRATGLPEVDGDFSPSYRETTDAYHYFTQPRQYKGVPYRDDQIIVAVDAKTGTVVDLNALFLSDVPASMERKIDSRKAEKTAAAALKAGGMNDAKLTGTRLAIVAGDANRQRGVSGAPPSRPPYLAWVVRFERTEPYSHAFYEVYVDAPTGKVVGRTGGGMVTLPPVPKQPRLQGFSTRLPHEEQDAGAAPRRLSRDPLRIP